MKKIVLGLFVSMIMLVFVANNNVVFGQQAKGDGKLDDSTEKTTAAISESDFGLKFSDGCLTGMGQGCFSYDPIIRGTGSDITEKNKNKTVTTIAQDVIVSATYMVGTVLTIVIIVCGLGYIFASVKGKGGDTSKYKTGLISAAIGAVLVRGAYAIIRLIQYIARG